MSDAYIGEIRLMAFNFPPSGWAHCDGQLLPINQNQALFSILGTTYGGNGQTNFALPDLRGRVPIHFGQGIGTPHVQGEMSGVENATLTAAHTPHSHALRANSGTGSVSAPKGNYPAASANRAVAYATSADTQLGATSESTGGGQPHPNMQPSLIVSFCICLSGLFPSPS